MSPKHNPKKKIPMTALEMNIDKVLGFLCGLFVAFMLVLHAEISF